MSTDVDHIDLFILQAVCEDLCPMERILSRAQSTLDREEIEEVAGRLLRLIELHLVNSYLLHAEMPFVTPAATDSSAVYHHWFFISQKGHSLLMEKNPAASCPTSHSSPRHLRHRFTRIPRSRSRKNL